MAKVGRNAPYPCGSTDVQGKPIKHKKCCLGKPPEPDPEEISEDREAGLERVRQALRRSGEFAGLIGALAGEDVDQQRRLEDHRHEQFLRSEFKRLGRTDEEIDKMFPKRRGR